MYASTNRLLLLSFMDDARGVLRRPNNIFQGGVQIISIAPLFLDSTCGQQTSNFTPTTFSLLFPFFFSLLIDFNV